MSARIWTLVVPFVVTLVGCNCDDESTPTGNETGGAGGGATVTGGTSAAAGQTATGGAIADGGEPSAGGSGAVPSGDGRADVIEVAVSGEANAYTFNVTLETSDVDCSHFADWWEVVTPEGELIYRRILAHPHTEGLSGNPFTRSGGPVEIASDQEVIVRAHLNDLGYVGVAQRGTASDGFTDAADIDASFAADIEGEEPQPSECIPEEQIVGG